MPLWEAGFTAAAIEREQRQLAMQLGSNLFIQRKAPTVDKDKNLIAWHDEDEDAEPDETDDDDDEPEFMTFDDDDDGGDRSPVAPGSDMGDDDDDNLA